MNKDIPVLNDDREVIGRVISVKNDLVPGAAGDAESAEDRDTRTPPWKTPEGKARKRLVRARKRQRAARRVQQAMARAR